MGCSGVPIFVVVTLGALGVEVTVVAGCAGLPENCINRGDWLSVVASGSPVGCRGVLKFVVATVGVLGVKVVLAGMRECCTRSAGLLENCLSNEVWL